MAAVDRILVVDDEPDILQTMRAALVELLGVPVEVDTASSGEEAQARLARDDGYALVITDEKMGGMRGTELLEWLRMARPGTIRVLMTAYRDGRILEDAVNRSKSHVFLSKPFDLDEMMRLLRGALAEHAAGRQRGVLN